MDAWQQERHRAFASFRDNKCEESIKHYKRALKLAAPALSDAADLCRFAATLNDLARVYGAKKDYQAAARTYKKAADMLQAYRNNHGVTIAGDVITNLLDALEGLAGTSQKLQQYDQSDNYYRQALAILSLVNDPTRKRDIIYEYHSFLLTQGRNADAEQLTQAERRVSLATPLPNTGDHCRGREDYNKAMAASEHHVEQQNLQAATTDCLLAVRCAQQLKDGRLFGDAATRLASCYAARQMNSQADAMYKAALQSYSVAKADDKIAFNCLMGYSHVLIAEGKFALAEAIAKRSLDVAETELKENGLRQSSALEAVLDNLVAIYEAQQRWDQAVAIRKRRYDLTCRKQHSLTNTDTIMQTCYLINTYYLARRKNEARALLNFYLQEIVRQSPPTPEYILPARLFTDFGGACLRGGNAEEAAWFFKSALEFLKHAPQEHTEIERAENQLKAAQTKAAQEALRKPAAI